MSQLVRTCLILRDIAEDMKTDNSNRSILRAISILKCFTPSEFELSGADISRKVGLHRATTHRILATLAESGVLHRIDKTAKYTIGPLLYQLGTLYLDTIDVFKVAKPVMEMVNELTNEDVVMGMLDKGNLVLVMKEETKFDLKIGRHVGESLPAYASSMGKALLSELTEAEIDSLYPEEQLQPVTAKTIRIKAELRRVLAEAKCNGVAYDRESGRIGVEGVSAVIKDARGNAVSALCIAMPVVRANQTKRKRLAKLVKTAADLISSRLGYQNAHSTISGIQAIRSWWDKQESRSDSTQSDGHTQPTRRHGYTHLTGVNA